MLSPLVVEKVFHMLLVVSSEFSTNRVTAIIKSGG